MIEQLLKAAPELRILVERTATGGGPTNLKAASITSLFFQLERQTPHNDWDYEEGLDTSELDSVMDEADVLWETEPEQALAIYLEMLGQIERAMAGWAQVYGDPFEDLFGSALNGVLSLVSEDRLPPPARQRAVQAALKSKHPGPGPERRVPRLCGGVEHGRTR